MNTFSRRQFLQLSGIAIAGTQIGFLPNLTSQTLVETYQGRALAALPVYSAQNAHAPVVTTLWPDSITPILDAGDGWYRVQNGFVERDGLQPMMPFQPASDVQLPNMPFWAEVAAPVAPIHQFCGANAPILSRIGHGGVAQVVDYLPGEPNGWYGIGDAQGNFIGWSQAVSWQHVDDAPSENAGERSIEIDLARQQLTAWENGEIALQAPCSTNSLLKPGQFAIENRIAGGTAFQLDEQPSPLHGIPWRVGLDTGGELTGVYWHNRFGSVTSGPSIQVTPLLARWLYGWVNDHSHITVH